MFVLPERALLCTRVSTHDPQMTSQRIRSPPLISSLRRRQPFDAAEPLTIECLLHYECKQQEVSSWHNDVVNWSLLHRQVLALGGLLPRFHSGRTHSSYGSGNVSTHSQVQLHWLSASRICSNTEYLQMHKALSTSAQGTSTPDYFSYIWGLMQQRQIIVSE
ncbi:uncharacterized protein [Triticum aestivum]|uniref:uncharacterized protein n=1 Tax=Triticum aestivum TaxID=4565 RepID=UPI001D0173FC|nr:uncharacterized protein LOC123054621 [Triticum aestivum]